MANWKRSGFLVLGLVFILVGSTAQAVDRRCSTICRPTSSCDLACTDDGAWTTCGGWGECAWCGGPLQSTGIVPYAGFGATSCEQATEGCRQDQESQISCAEPPACMVEFQASECSFITCGGEVCGYNVNCRTNWRCRN